MIAKKNSGLDLEKKRTALFQIGLLASASFTLAAFTYTSALPNANDEHLFASAAETMVIELQDPPEPEKISAPPAPEVPMTMEDPLLSDPSVSSQMDLQAISDAQNTSSDVPTFGLPFGLLTGGTVHIDEDVLDDFPPTPAEYRGGPVAMQNYINEQVRYPEIDRQMGIEGTVYVAFIVEKNGTVSNVKIENHISETIDREAMRVVRLLNQWIPAENAFGKVRTTVRLPIRFFLKN
ncbi:MAG: hypothetical protein A3D92_04855 [Bacteroidetes bacterium RIFCSPHIGHO2_02_FULL_44_7]|nr:MAG: hypothetical protein A3D92_04855 [Bacteroidetes bacterium RIFCSPHIGHO2_02_FULL_44_7]